MSADVNVSVFPICFEDVDTLVEIFCFPWDTPEKTRKKWERYFMSTRKRCVPLQLPQKLYVKLGYVPDGNGITYKSKKTVPGTSYPLDDDLILWLKKPLEHASS